MKKLVMMLVVMAMAVPVMAGTITMVSADNADGTCTITWTADVAIRGLGLNVDCTAGVIDDAVVDSFFDIFMDYAADMEGTAPGSYTYGAGHPIADKNASGPDTLPSAAFCISAGGLGGEAAPLDPAPTSGTFVLSSTAGAEGTITANTLRGGVVDVDANPVDIVGGAFVITNGPVDCYVGPDQAEWVAAGKPLSWCNPYQCYGDADGLMFDMGWGMVAPVGPSDVPILLAAYKAMIGSANENVDADFDHIKFDMGWGIFTRVGPGDVSLLLANYKKASISMTGDCNTAP